jgi:hypothetical protein
VRTSDINVLTIIEDNWILKVFSSVRETEDFAILYLVLRESLRLVIGYG